MASARPPQAPFRLAPHLQKAGVSHRLINYPRQAIIFSQGSPATCVFYIERGAVKLSVTSSLGKEAVIGMFGPGDFFGEGCLAGQSTRLRSAEALVPTQLMRIEKLVMVRLLAEQHDFANRFMRQVLDRTRRVEEDLVDQLFNSSEKRLARTLLLLARYAGHNTPSVVVVPKVSQETLAEMIGSTRSRVNLFMTKFRRLGFIEYNGDLKIYPSLLSVILKD